MEGEEGADSVTPTNEQHETALELARLLPVLGLMVTEPLPELLRDSRSQMILLQILSARGAATVSEMAVAMGIAVPTVSTMVRKMVEKGLLERNQDPEDWRSIRLSLSAAGRELLQEMAERRAERVGALLERLPAEELATIRSALQILGRLVEK